jgi:glycine cleavage system H protein
VKLNIQKNMSGLKLEGDIGTIGITQHATEMLGDIVFVELPDVGSQLKKMVMLE